MTIFRFELFSCVSSLLLLVTASAAASEERRPAECSNIDPFAVRKGVGARIERKEQLMGQQFIKARKAVAQSFAHYGSNDSRTDPRFLDHSQAAWKRFVENNCTVIAAYGGGSNSAISDRLMYCYEGELDHRIEFLRGAAEASGEFGP
jgi:uncharacterized protein YecT (DUF1311 family)